MKIRDSYFVIRSLNFFILLSPLSFEVRSESPAFHAMREGWLQMHECEAKVEPSSAGGTSPSSLHLSTPKFLR